MDSWPYDDRQASQEPSHKGKAIAKGRPSRDYPYLQQGMVSAVTLSEKNGRFQWSCLRTQGSYFLCSYEALMQIVVESTKRWRSGKPFKVFPETRGPLPRKSPFGPKLSAQHGVRLSYSLSWSRVSLTHCSGQLHSDMHARSRHTDGTHSRTTGRGGGSHFPN